MKPRFIPSFIFLFQFYQLIISAYSTNVSTSTTPHLCSSRNSLFLWQFRQSFHINPDASYYDRSLQPWYPKTKTWNRSVDCCTWDGVTCDELTREIIGLDLSCSQLKGSINSNHTLFKLSHLQTLNLAFNALIISPIHSNFAGFQSLTHLNLSNTYLSGSLPSEFLRMFNLISLDLSTSWGNFTIEPHIFELLLQNMTKLRQVSLQDCYISSMLPRNLSTFLQLLNLRGTELFGKIPVEIFQLPNLQMLQLSNNLLKVGNSLRVKNNVTSTTRLRYLDVSDNDVSGEYLPELFGSLKHLYYLDLSECNFSGPIPLSFGNLTQMRYLHLYANNLTGQLPPSLESLEKIISLDLSANNLDDQLPNVFNNFKSMSFLGLTGNFFNSCIPSSIINLTKLETLDLSYNSLIGPLPAKPISGFPNLVELNLAENSISGSIPSWVFSLPSLASLDMSSNQLTGQLRGFRYQTLQFMNFPNNKLNGPVPRSISKLVNLRELDLSYNNFSGHVEVSLFSSLPLLDSLSLSFNNLSLINNRGNSTLPSSITFLYLSSCGLRDLEFLTGLKCLVNLDLSYNDIQGQIFSQQRTSTYTWFEGLVYLNLSHNSLTDIHKLPSQSLSTVDISTNFLTGSLPIPSVYITNYFASNNAFSGGIPSHVCKFSSLKALDLSNNSLSGEIPKCLGNLPLLILDLSANNFQGTIPSTFSHGCELISLNLRDNQLEGEFPQSLSNCLGLELLNIGNNNFHGTFPWRLGALQSLQVLSLRANNFYGSLSHSEWGLSFPLLRILDLSENNFTGTLPARFFIQLTSMKIVNHIKKRLFNELGIYYISSVLVTTKGIEIDVMHVLSTYTTIDLSSNKFDGVIPNSIGNLVSLRGLNLSHNKFRGPIPQSFAKLNILESLDLSSNELVGEIPQQMVSLTNLEVLNLSKNHLAGSIPQGSQFDTFENTSYLRNDDLCGFPLSKTCGAQNIFLPVRGEISTQYDEKEHKHFINGFSWQAVLIGYGTGIIIGMSIGCLIFIMGKPKWFNKLVENECSRFRKKKWPKEIKWL